MSTLLRTALALACLGLLATPAQGSGARLFALGGDGAYLEDAVGARVWYGSLADHGGWAALESGVFDQHGGYGRDQAGWRAAGPAGGVQVPLGQAGRHGTAGLWWHDRAANGGSGELGDDRLQTAWQVMYARALGPVTAGLSLRHGAGAIAAPADSVSTRATRDDFGLGLRWAPSDRAYVDLAGELVRLADEATVGAEPAVSRSTSSSYGLRARGFLQVGTGLVLVPVVERRTEQRDWNTMGQPGDRSWRLWRLGAGLTWLPDPDHLVLIAADWRDGRRRTPGGTGTAADLDRRVFALRLACEARIHALLSLRVASGFELVHQEWVGADAPSDDHLVPLSAGLAAHVGPCDLDLALGNQPPVRPDGGRQTWQARDDSTWMSAGLSFWF